MARGVSSVQFWVSKKHFHFFNRTPIWRRSPFWFICFLSGLDKDSFFVFCFLKSKVVLDVWWFGKVAKDICQMVDNYSLVIQHCWLKDFLIGTTSTTCRCSKLCLRVIYWGSNLEIGWNTQLDPKNFLPCNKWWLGILNVTNILPFFFFGTEKNGRSKFVTRIVGWQYVGNLHSCLPRPQKKNIWDGRLKKNLENHPLRHPSQLSFGEINLGTLLGVTKRLFRDRGGFEM